MCIRDSIRPTRCVVEESQRYLRLEHEDNESYVSYFTVNAIVGDVYKRQAKLFIDKLIVTDSTIENCYEFKKEEIGRAHVWTPVTL